MNDWLMIVISLSVLVEIILDMTCHFFGPIVTSACIGIVSLITIWEIFASRNKH